jgi:hypothetical protein
VSLISKRFLQETDTSGRPDLKYCPDSGRGKVRYITTLVDWS